MTGALRDPDAPIEDLALRAALDHLEPHVPEGWSVERFPLPDQGRWVAWACEDGAEWVDRAAFGESETEAVAALARVLRTRP